MKSSVSCITGEHLSFLSANSLKDSPFRDYRRNAMSEVAVTEITKDKRANCSSVSMSVTFKVLLICACKYTTDCFSNLFCINPFCRPRVMFNSVAQRIHFITEGGTSS